MYLTHFMFYDEKYMLYKFLCIFKVSLTTYFNLYFVFFKKHFPGTHRAPVSALCALEPSSRALGKGLEVENTDRRRDRPTRRPFNTDTKAPLY